MKPPATTLKPGQVLTQRYAIDAFLEKKGHANLYRAIDQVTGLTVIIKESEANEARERKTTLVAPGVEAASNPWYDEFAILRSVSYPTLVKGVDIFQEEDRAYLVIEQLEGHDLGYFLTQHRPTVQQSCDWIIQLCQSLSQLHRRGIVHLDLTPRYVIVSPDLQRVRLTGLDRARQLPVRGLKEFTDGYSAPELKAGGEVDERADVYSLGVLWHQLLTGFDPTRAPSANSRRLAFPAVSHFLAAVHPEVPRIIQCMVHPDPYSRYESVEAVKRAILDLLASTPSRVGYLTDVGQLREHNEDSLFVLQQTNVTFRGRHPWGLYIVADGMGGGQAGEEASAMSVREASQTLLAQLKKQEDSNKLDFENLVVQAVKKANSSVYQASRRNAQFAGMGTTLTMGLVYAGGLHVGHVGDSRAYLINASGIEKISRDHSLVGRLLEMGQITVDEAAIHPQRNLIYRSLGAYADVEVDYYHVPFGPNDHLLLCSDGLNEHVRDDEMMEIVTSTPDVHLACCKLVNLANQRGGDDNITVVLVTQEELRA